MPRNDLPSARPPADRHHRAILVLLAGIAAGALLARRADGSAVLPVWLEIGLQAPAVLAWCHWRCAWFGLRKRRADAPPTDGRAVADRWLTLLVIVGGVVLGFVLDRPEVCLATVTAFVAGILLLDGLSRLYGRVAGRIQEPAGLLRTLAGPWLAMIVVVTVLLSLPLSTQSAVPDYRHNFLDHVLNSAQAAASSASLVGTLAYSFGQEYALFGQIVLVVTTQLAGMGFAALGLAILQPFMRNTIRLRTVLLTCLALQALAVGAMWTSWSGGDAASPGDRLWWGVVHAGSALWNTGLTLRNDGLAAYVSSGAVFTAVTTLAIIGSLGMPVILDLVSWPRPKPTTGSRVEDATRPMPWRRLPQWEAGIALALLLTGAVVLFVCETPWGEGVVWRLPESWIPERPVDLGSSWVPLRDDMAHRTRWSVALFVSATLRSAGMQSIPISEGAVSWPSYGLLLIWIFVGGSAGGVAGGVRTSAFLLIVLCLIGGRALWASRPGGEAGRRLLLRASLGSVPLWLAWNAISIGLLAAASDADSYEVVFEGMAACNSVGLSSGLSLHLTPTGRVVMIAVVVAGRVLPVAYWLGVSRRFTRCLRGREDHGSSAA